MNIIDAPQGSQEWLDARAKYFTASEAPAMMGASKYQTRSELLRQKATGIAAEVDSNTQRLFDRGHAAEAAARPIVERIIGAELFPTTGALEVDGLPLLASFDGLTMLDDAAWENKLFNAALADQVRAGQLEPHYYWQLEQQLLVSGAERVYFTTSDGTPENTVGMWYESQPERRAALIAGWKQFAEDLAEYRHTEPAREAVAEPQMALPSVSIQVNGSIALIDNLDVFGEALTAYVERINTKPETDDDFATLEATVKTLKKAEDALDSAENGALAQAASIDTMRRTVAMLRDMARSNRLLIDKLVKAEKENRRAEIVKNAQIEITGHIRKLNERIGGQWMPVANFAPFTEAVKGLKSLDSMRDKVSTALAQAKIEANEIADRIQANRLALLDAGRGLVLFPDFAHVCTKATDDFAALLALRIQQDDQRLEAEREAAVRQEQARAEAQRAQQAAHEAQAQAADATEAPAAVAAPVTARAAMSARHDTNDAATIDDAMIDDFIRLLPISAVEKKALRANLVKWEKYRIARQMQEAA